MALLEVNDIEVRFGGKFDRAVATGCLAHDGDVGGAAEDHAKPDPHDLVIVDDQHRDRLSVGVGFGVGPLRHPATVGNAEKGRRPPGG